MTDILVLITLNKPDIVCMEMNVLCLLQPHDEVCWSPRNSCCQFNVLELWNVRNSKTGLTKFFLCSWAAMQGHFRVGLQGERSKQKQEMQKAVVLNTRKHLSGILRK